MDLLKKTLKVSAIGALTASLAFGVMDAKAEDAGTTITATVQNAITFAETTPLSFGTFVAIADDTDVSTIVVAPDGTISTTNPGDARVVVITDGAAGVFDVSNAAPGVTLDLDIPTTVTLTCAACAPTNPTFEVGTFVSNPVAGADAVTTNGSGAATIQLGATLTTAQSATPYEDGTYSGSYTVSVNY